MQEQLPRPLRLVVEAVALQIFGDVGVDQPEFAVLGIGIGLRDRALAAADRFDLGAGQGKAGLDRVLDRIVEASLAVLCDALDRAFVLLGHFQLFFRRSRISVSNSTSRLGFGGAAGAASSLRLSWFMRRITMNSTNATIRKLIVSVRKLPQATTAPCFLASARLVAVTDFERPVK